MAFICKDCVPENAKWRFELIFAYKGPCEKCGYTKVCTDIGLNAYLEAQEVKDG